jgi:hypothetical protein
MFMRLASFHSMMLPTTRRGGPSRYLQDNEPHPNVMLSLSKHPRAKRSAALLPHPSTMETPGDSAFGSGFAGGLIAAL